MLGILCLTDEVNLNVYHHVQVVTTMGKAYALKMLAQTETVEEAGGMPTAGMMMISKLTTAIKTTLIID